jgi:hypothetical protein
MRKNGDTRFKIRVLPIHIIFCVGVAATFALKGKRENAVGILRAVAFHLRPFSRRSFSRNNTAPRDSLAVLSSVTVPLKPQSALRMLRVYLVRW